MRLAVLMAVMALFGAANCRAPPLQDANRAQKQQGADHDQVVAAAGFSPALAFSLSLPQRQYRPPMALSRQNVDARSSPPGLARMLTRPPRRGGAASFCAASMSAGAELVSVEAAKKASFEQVGVAKGRERQGGKQGTGIMLTIVHTCAGAEVRTIAGRGHVGAPEARRCSGSG
jgi:hypothetical protein